MVQIKILRHSERLDYTYPLYWLLCFGQYWADSPLTSNGHRIANIKGKELKTDNFDPKYIYTSPYSRTLATATEINNTFTQSEVIIEPLLSEYQPNFRHRISLYPDGIPTTFEGEQTDFSYPESYDNFSKRIKYIINKLIDRHDCDLIIVTHGEVLKTFVSHIQNMYPDILLDPGNTPYLTVLSFEYDKKNNVIIEKSVRID